MRIALYINTLTASLQQNEPWMLCNSFIFGKIEMSTIGKISSLSLGITDFRTSPGFCSGSPCQTRVSRGTLLI